MHMCCSSSTHPLPLYNSMAPSGSSSKGQSSTSSSFTKLYNGSFLPSSLGNAVACYSSATFAAGGQEGGNGSNSNTSKGKGKSTVSNKSNTGKNAASAAADDDGDVKFVEFDTLKRSRRTVGTQSCAKQAFYKSIMLKVVYLSSLPKHTPSMLACRS